MASTRNEPIAVSSSMIRIVFSIVLAFGENSSLSSGIFASTFPGISVIPAHDMNVTRYEHRVRFKPEILVCETHPALTWHFKILFLVCHSNFSAEKNQALAGSNEMSMNA